MQGTYDPIRKTYRKKSGNYRWKGVPDIIGFYLGRFVAFEIKTPKRKTNVSKEQKEFIEIANKNGAMAMVVTSLDDVTQILKSIRTQKDEMEKK